MSGKNKKQFGVWLNSQHATIVGRENANSGAFAILAHEESARQEGNSNENAGNNAERGSLQKLFKNISSHMQNVEEVHVTGTGVAQEQFIKFLAESPQFKNAVAKQSTSIKMSDERLIGFISEQFN